MSSPNTEELLDPELCSDGLAGLDDEHGASESGRFSGKFARWITKGGLAIVDQGLISGLRWGTAREDSGLLPETTAQRDARETASKESAGQTNKTQDEMLARGKAFLSGLADRGKLELDPQQFALGLQ